MNKNFIPKVIFKMAPIKIETDMLRYFTSEKNSRRIRHFEKRYPELLEELKKVKKAEEKFKVCENFAKKIHRKNKKIMEAFQKEIQSKWNKINDPFLKTLSSHFQTDWPKNKKEIVGYVSILHVFPRFLDEYSFCLGYKNIDENIEVSAHEIVHFLWFKKWKEVFPEIKRSDYESPNLVWRLSEIIVQIILQTEPKIKKLIKPEGWDYDSFKKIKIGKLSMTDHFLKKYLQFLETEKDFGMVMKRLWKETQKHEEKISDF